jgi:GH35 family endo-1,4-beta-xylanase
MGKLKDLNPHKGEIVNIKFKSINEIMDNTVDDFHGTEETYEIADNIKAYIAGGHFIVSEILDEVDCKDDTEHNIKVINHLDCNYGLPVYEDAIESIEIVADSERFESKDHKILIVRVEDEMFINGHPLIWNERQDKKQHDRDSKKSNNKLKGKYENPNRKLLKMFENYIADMALKESLDAGE